MPTDLLFVIVLRTLVELAGYFLLGRGLLHVLSGRRRERNPVYKVFRLLTAPVIKVTRTLAPKALHDRHVPFVAFIILFWMWIALAVLKRHLCAFHQIACV